MIEATAPGKLILAGEHAAVYGRPALVAALGLRTRVTVQTAPDDRLRLDLPNVGVEERTTWDAVAAYGREKRRAWEAYREHPDGRRLAALSSGDPAHVVKVALAETFRALGVTPRGVALRVESELPVGAGFGSSASVAVATVGALSMILADQFESALVDRVAFEVERRQHGRPSGADHATVLNGGLQWFERHGDHLKRRTLAFDRRVLGRLSVYHTGRPAESTGELVESVRRRFADRPEQLREILDSLERDARGLRETLASGAEGARSLGELIGSCEQGLERLGVVPEAVRARIRDLEARGAAAKISGAGALSGEAAGALLAYPAGDGADSLESLAAYERLDVDLGMPGLELDLGLGLDR